MIDSIKQLKVGDHVHYQPEHYIAEDRFENGIVKEIPDHCTDAVRVVYNCNQQWHRYQDYTSALTELADLCFGWRGQGGDK